MCVYRWWPFIGFVLVSLIITTTLANTHQDPYLKDVSDQVNQLQQSDKLTAQLQTTAPAKSQELVDLEQQLAGVEKELNLPPEWQNEAQAIFGDMGLHCSIYASPVIQHQLKGRVISPLDAPQNKLFITSKCIGITLVNVIMARVSLMALNTAIAQDNIILGAPAMASLAASVIALSINAFISIFTSSASNPPLRAFWAPFTKPEHQAKIKQFLGSEVLSFHKSVLDELAQTKDLKDAKKALLSKTYSPYKYNALQLMVLDRHQDLTESLLVQGADPNYENLNSDSSFTLAIDKAETRIFKSLYQNNNLDQDNHSTYQRDLALLKAIRWRLRHILSALISVTEGGHVKSIQQLKKDLKSQLTQPPESYLNLVEKLLGSRARAATEEAFKKWGQKITQQTTEATNNTSVSHTEENLILDELNVPRDLLSREAAIQRVMTFVKVMALENSDSNFTLEKLLKLARGTDALAEKDEKHNTLLHHALVSGNYYAINNLLFLLSDELDAVNLQGVSARQLLQHHALQLEKISRFLHEQANKNQQLKPQSSKVKKLSKLHLSNAKLCLQLLTRLQKPAEL